ncbi:MAG: N-acetylmuramoyl-L-alanine amidase [Patescibacteria group bacterium]
MLRAIAVFLSLAGVLFASFVFVMLIGDSLGFSLSDRLLGSVFPITISTPDLHKAYMTEKIKMLIVPGHDNEYGGGEWRHVRESDLTLEASRNLEAYFKKDSRFETIVARDTTTGQYAPALFEYFTKRRDDIIVFKNIAQKKMETLKAHNFLERNVSIERNSVSSEIAFRLYGINKWANENDVDIVLHVHFNDYPGHRGRAGDHTGFSIYVPEKQYGNADASKDLARTLFDELKNTIGPSTLPLERDGVIEDQELIALGANASLKSASVLVEYGYIYEPQYIYEATRNPMMQELAFQTYRAVKKHFEKNSPNYIASQTALLPYRWSDGLEKGIKGSASVLALQAALKKDGLYPPPGKSLVDCPLTGSFGACTELAVRMFQQRYAAEILGGDAPSGRVGVATAKKLNEVFGRN